MSNYKIVNVTQLENDLSLLADKIREKTRTTDSLEFPNNYIESVDTLATRGGLKGILERTATELIDDSIEVIGYYGLFENEVIQKLVLPNLKRIDEAGCCYCRKLEIADIGATYLDVNAFGGCEKLKTLVLRADTVCELVSTSLFFNSPFAGDGSGGVAYVPEALIESYKSATNWSSLHAWGSCRFESIEGSIYEL